MSTQMDERPPHGLESLYERELGGAPFSVDDIVAGGRRRVHRTRAAVGSAVAAAAAVVLAVSVGSPFDLDRTPAPPAGPTPSVTTAAVREGGVLDGCTLAPAECEDTIEYWVSQSLHGGRDTTVRRQPADPGYGVGALAFSQQFGDSARERFGVVVAPAWDGGPPAADAHTVRLGSPAVASVETSQGGDSYRQVWTVAAKPGVHGGIRVVLEGPPDTRPRDWDDSTVSGLLDVLLGTEQGATPAPAPTVTPRSASVGCSLALGQCDSTTLSDWVSANLGAEVTPQRFPLMDKDTAEAKRIGEVLLGAYGEESSQTTVAVSFGNDVGRFGGLYGDSTLEPRSPRSVALPSGGAASVYTWDVQGAGTYREMWLVPPAPGRGEMRVLLKQGTGEPPGLRRPLTPVERLEDAAVVDLIEDFR